MAQLFLFLFTLIFTCFPAYAQLTEKFTWVDKSIAEKASGNYSIDFNYPIFRVSMDKASNASIKVINKRIVDLAKDQTQKFKSEFAALKQKDAGWKEGTLTANYKVYSRNNCIVSLTFNTEKYISPSAHPTHSTLPLNYEFYTAKPLELKNIFKKGSNYLGTLSKLCYEYLTTTMRNPDEEWIRKGTMPVNSNFRTFYITPESFNIVFDEYAVNCYAGGPQTVPIKYSQIIQLINPKNPVYYYASAQQ